MGNTFGSAIEQAARFQKALEEIRALEDSRIDEAVQIAVQALSAIQVDEGKTDERPSSVSASSGSQPDALGSGDSEQVTSKDSAKSCPKCGHLWKAASSEPWPPCDDARHTQTGSSDTHLMRKLVDALETVRALVDGQDCFECRGDEDCDHCLAIYHVIDPALAAAKQAPAVEQLAKERDEERAFWASKFEHWAKCQESGGSWAMRKADGFRDCAKVLRENDRWVPPGVEVTRPVTSEGDK